MSNLRLKRFGLVILLWSLLWQGGIAQDIKLVERAQAGNAEAQFELGLLYYSGRGVPRDYQTAFKWWKRAANHGNAKAQNNLGVMYRKGIGVPQDPQKAMGWYQKAADQGYTMAQQNLLEWWEREAEAGNVIAQFNLGTLYHRGTSVPRDLIKAYTWYAIAAFNGDKDGETWRDYMMTELAPQDISNAQQFIKQWTRTYAQRGEVD